MTLLITGANRGLGLEFVRQYAARGERIFAACRAPQDAADLNALAGSNGHIIVLPLDVTDDASIDAAYDAVAAQTNSLDLLINNAGMYVRGESPGALDRAQMLDSFNINTVGPLLVSQRFLGLVAKGNNPRIANITSQLGSLERKRGGGSYSYCSSKAALNMMTKALAYDVRGQGVTVIMVHPGWVQTDMGGSGAPLTPGESIAGMVDLFDRLTPTDTARYLQWDGAELPW